MGNGTFFFKFSGGIASQNKILLSKANFQTDMYHLDYNAAEWNDARNSATGNYNSWLYYKTFYDSGYYQIARAIIRINFSNITPRTVNSAKIILLKNTFADPIDQSCYAYFFSNNGLPVSSDYANTSGALFSGEGVIVSGNRVELTLNAAGIAAVQSALDNKAILSMMLRSYYDANNITPGIINYNYSLFDYNTSYLELT